MRALGFRGHGKTAIKRIFDSEVYAGDNNADRGTQSGLFRWNLNWSIQDKSIQGFTFMQGSWQKNCQIRQLIDYLCFPQLK